MTAVVKGPSRKSISRPLEWINHLQVPAIVINAVERRITHENKKFLALLQQYPNWDLRNIVMSNIDVLSSSSDEVAEAELILSGQSLQSEKLQISSSILYSDGLRVIVVGVMRILTTPQSSELSLVESLIDQLELKNQVLRVMSEGVWVLDHSGKIVYANPALETMLNPRNLSEISIIGRTIEDFVHTDDRSKIPSLFGSSGPVRVELRLLPVHLQAEAAKMIVTLVHQTSLFNENGEYAGSIGAISDISDLKILSDRMQERTQELIQTEKMASIGLLISEVAHEVNNPISFILSNTETSRDYFKTLLEFLRFQEKALETDKLEKDAETPSNSAIVLARIHKQRKKLNLDFIIKDLPKLLESNLKGLERVRDVVSDLRMASRPVSDLKYVPVNLQESLDLVINMLGHRLSPLIKILKEYGLPPRLQKVSAIPAKLDQIWVNLITNAIQAIEEKDPARGKIVVKTSLEKEKLLKVEIIDDGIGISPDNKQKIFHPFFTTKAPTKGTGLGLSICMRIVQEFGGAIALFSEGEGKGAKVVVSLPTIAEQTE